MGARGRNETKVHESERERGTLGSRDSESQIAAWEKEKEWRNRKKTELVKVDCVLRLFNLCLQALAQP